MPRRRELQPSPRVKVIRAKTVCLPRQGRLPEHVRDRDQADQLVTVLRWIICPIPCVLRFYTWMFTACWRVVRPKRWTPPSRTDILGPQCNGRQTDVSDRLR